MADLASPLPDVRADAVRRAGDCDAAWSSDVLLTALEDPDPEVRGEATHALGERRDRRAVLPLIAALRDGEVAAGAAWALGRIGDPAAAEPLVALLEHSAPAVRAAAARALGDVGDRGAVLALEVVINDPATDPGLRNAALDSLVALGYAPEGMRPTSLVMWAAGLGLVAAAVAAAAAWGALAIVPFAAGLGLLFLYYVREVRRARRGGWYAHPDDGAAIWVPAELGGAIGDVGDGGGAAGGGGG